MVAIEQAEAPPISRTEKLLRQMEALVEEMELARPPYDAHGFARNYAIAVTHLEDAMLRLRLAPRTSGQPSEWNSARPFISSRLCATVLPKPKPGSIRMRSRAMPADSAATIRSSSHK